MGPLERPLLVDLLRALSLLRSLRLVPRTAACQSPSLTAGLFGTFHLHGTFHGPDPTGTLPHGSFGRSVMDNQNSRQFSVGPPSPSGLGGRMRVAGARASRGSAGGVWAVATCVLSAETFSGKKTQNAHKHSLSAIIYVEVTHQTHMGKHFLRQT